MKEITISISLDEAFYFARRESSYLAAKLAAAQDAPDGIFDRIALVESDSDMFSSLFSGAVAHLAASLVRFGYARISHAESTSEICLLVHSSFNDAYIDEVRKKAMEYVARTALAEWYLYCGFSDAAQNEAPLVQIALQTIQSFIFHRNRPTL